MHECFKSESTRYKNEPSVAIHLFFILTQSSKRRPFPPLPLPPHLYHHRRWSSFILHPYLFTAMFPFNHLMSLLTLLLLSSAGLGAPLLDNDWSKKPDDAVQRYLLLRGKGMKTQEREHNNEVYGELTPLAL
jgi:hypothetical protein